MKKVFIGLSLLGLLLAFEVPSYGQNDIIWVPIKVHILRKTDGTVEQGKEINLDRINHGVAYANRKFKDSHVQFFISEIVNLDSDKWYNNTFQSPYLFGYNGKNLPASTISLNLYLVPRITTFSPLTDWFNGGQPTGASAFPITEKLSNTHLLIRLSPDINKSLFCYTMAHELGHIFYLKHTFAPDIVKENIIRDKSVSNCQIAGDGLCDTNADHYPSYKKQIGYSSTKDELVYIGDYKDKYGNKYNPPFDNLMSYYYGFFQNFPDVIRENFKFTSEQNQRIKQFAALRAYEWKKITLNHPGYSFENQIVLSTPTTTKVNWSHNSSNETGYFIERSTNLNPDKFVCIGGVGPNISTFNDPLPIPAGVNRVNYRVIPSNAKGNNYYSNIVWRDIETKAGIVEKNSPNPNPLLSQSAISSTINICKNTSFPIEYYTEGAFAVNNQFKIQLSDQNGNFGANPLIIGTGTSSPINVTIPNQSFPNGNYKLRIVSTNPVTTSLASVDTYNIYPVVTPPAITATPANVSYGSASVLKATGCTGTVYWSFNKTGSTQVVKPTENTTYTAYCKTNCNSDEGTISVIVNNTAGISNINYMEYFFDNDPGFGNGVAVNIKPGSLLETTIPVNTTGLSQGLHTLHVRVKTASNQWSTTHTQAVLVYGTGNNNRIVKFEYFYDTDPGFDNGTAVTVSPDSLVYLEGEFRTNNLSQGLHRLFVRAKDGYNRWSTTEQTPVLVIGTGSTIGLLSSAEYFIDTDPGVGNATSVSIPSQTEATFSFNVNLSNVSQGVHVVYVRVKDNLNRWSTHQSQVFVKIPNTLTRQITKAEYFIDTDPGQGNATAISYSPNPAQEMIANININANSLMKGEHTIYVRVNDSNNVWSVIASKLFEVESTPCPPVESLFLPSLSGLTQAMERIFSTSKIESNNKSTYQAGNSVLLSPGFETKSNVVFKVIISGCVND